jgi:hypothetical protein
MTDNVAIWAGTSASCGSITLNSSKDMGIVEAGRLKIDRTDLE